VLDPGLKDEEQCHTMESDIHIQQKKLFQVEEGVAKNFQAILTNIPPEVLNADVVEGADQLS
jgi:hypothetical protein